MNHRLAMSVGVLPIVSTMCVYLYRRVLMYVCVYIHSYVGVCKYVFMFVCTPVCVYHAVCVIMYVNMCVHEHGLYIFPYALANLDVTSIIWNACSSHVVGIFFFGNRGSRESLQSVQIPSHSYFRYVQFVATQGSLASVTFTPVLPTVRRGSFMSTARMNYITIDTWLLNK